MSIALSMVHFYIVLGWSSLCLLGAVLLPRPWRTWFAAAITLVMAVLFWAWL